MDKDELILQKLTELSTDLKDIRTELKETRTELFTELKEVRTELKGTRAELSSEITDVEFKLSSEITDVRAELSTEIKTVRAELSAEIKTVRAELKQSQEQIEGVEQEVVDVKLRQADFRNDSQAADLKMAGDIHGLETKIDGLTSSIRERKSDFVERVKMGGIIFSGIIAIAALIHTVFFS